MDRKYVESKLQSFLGFEVPKEMIDHIFNLNNEQDVREYFNDLLDKSDQKQRQFVSEFINKRNLKNLTSKRKDNNRSKKKNKSEPELFEIKSDFDELEKQYQINNKKDIKVKESHNRQTVSEEKNISVEEMEKMETPLEKFKKTTYSPFDYNAQAFPLLPGRRFCGCFAKRHTLINNCLKCGRLQCEQEGSGPCMYCGELVVSRQEKQILESDTPEAENLLAKLLKQPKPEGWRKAVDKQRNLRNADLARKERQKIIDDQTDYFTLSYTTWKAKTQEEAYSDMAKQLQENAENKNVLKSQTNSKLTMISQIPSKGEQKSMSGKGEQKLANKNMTSRKEETGIKFDDKWRLTTARELGMICQIAPIDDALVESLKALPEMHMPELREKLFYQDPRTVTLMANDDSSKVDNFQDEFWELNDYFDRLGFCLSIRQPYASLIMAGIKMHEGRSWSTDLRGILWIASASYEPTKEEITTVENFYRKKFENVEIKFPKNYPTSRLLGRVQIETCLNREDYYEKYPYGEVDSDWVFIFKEIIPLPIVFPISGHNAIYMLPKKLHTAAGLIVRRLIRENPSLLEP